MIDVDDFTRLTDVQWRSTMESEHGIFIAEGFTTIKRAIECGHRLRSVVCADRWRDGLVKLGIAAERIAIRSELELQEVTGYHVHRGALASFERPALPPVDQVLRDAHRIVVVEDVVDHANIGAIIRSVAGFDFDAVLLTPRSADPLYRRAVKVSMGNVFKVTWTRIDWPMGLQTLHEFGFVSIALTPDPSALPIQQLMAGVDSARIALLVGSEGDGLHPKTLRDATVSVRIPMANGVDSLNVAAATAVACYELTR